MDQNLLKNKINTIEYFSTKFQLILPKEEIYCHYPNLAQQFKIDDWDCQNQQYNSNNYIKFQYSLILKKCPQEPLTYRIIKSQRFIFILSKISRAIPHFEKILDCFKLQKQKSEPRLKNNSQQTPQEQNSNIEKEYLQKGENFLQRLLKTYNQIIAILKPKPKQIIKLTLQDFLVHYLFNKKKKLINESQNTSNQMQKKDLQQYFIEKIKDIKNQYKQCLKDIFGKIFTIYKKDNLIAEFLNGSHKFYKSQNIENLNSQSNHYDKFERSKVLFEKIDPGLFLLSFGVQYKQNYLDEVENGQINFSKYKLLLGWNFKQPETTGYSFQIMFQYLYEYQLRDTGLSTQQKQLKYNEKLDDLINKFQKNLIKTIFSDLEKSIKKFFQDFQLVKIYQFFQIQRTNQNGEYENQDKVKYFVHKTPEYDFKQMNLYQMYQTEPEEQVKLSIYRSRSLLEDFFQKYYSSVLCFIESEKKWFFIEEKTQKHNFNYMYSKFASWIPINIDSLSLITTEGQNIFQNYVSGLVYSLFRLYDKSTVDIIERTLQQQTVKQFKTTESPSFLYNELRNIVLYQNFAFESIQHCHYYFKHYSFDVRCENSNPNYMIEYINKQEIRLFVRSNINKKFNKLRTLQNDDQEIRIKLMQIPIRGVDCHHFDFFDLIEVYHLIFPYPFCQPQKFECPKCQSMLEFQDLIYLREIALLLENIKLFYLPKQEIPKKNGYKNDVINNIAYGQNNSCLTDLRLIIDHLENSVLLKGKYYQTKQYEKYKNFKKKGNSQSFALVNFEHQLDPQIYQTLRNPTKNFKPSQKFKTFLSNFGRNKKSIEQQQNNERMLKFQNIDIQGNGIFPFIKQIQLSRVSLNSKWQFYKDLQKGTITQ